MVASRANVAVRLLLVEDNPEHAELFRAVLGSGSAERITMSHVSSVAEALEYLLREEADIILLDLGLPDCTGLDGLERIHEFVPGTPLVILSALEDEGVAARALHKGAQDYLIKGLLDYGQLTRAIRYSIERNQAVRALDVLTGQLRDANTQLQKVAILDPLTELLNRRGLQQALSREIQWAQRHQGSMVALLLDLDDFKRINDVLGHAAGDVVLKESGDRMRACTRATDYVARIGGDEFMILLPQTTLGQGRQIAEKVRLRISETPISWSAEAVKVTASVGLVPVSAGTPSVDELLSRMHLVLAQSKQSGKNQVSYEGQNSLNGNGNGHGNLAPVLEALRRGDTLRVVKQPIFRLADEQVVGYEFFSRLGSDIFEDPEDFFRICHEAEILTLVDHRCFKNCLSAAAELPGQFRRHLNIFPSTMLALPVHNLLEAFPSNIPKATYCIEISEQQMIGAHRNLTDVVRYLKLAGILIAVDDLGSASSSVEGLTVLEPDIVKIDKKWVTGVAVDIPRLRSLQRLLKMVGAIGAEVIVEGIECRDDFDVLKDLGVQYGQGYLWGKSA